MLRTIVCVLIVILFAVTFAVVTDNLVEIDMTDDELEKEKQRLYELIDTIPKDVEQAIILDDVIVSIDADNIKYTYSGNQCDLVITYDREYNIVNEAFVDKREYDQIIVTCMTLFGGGVGAAVILLWFKIEASYRYVQYKYNRKRKKQERTRKKAEKKKAQEQAKEIKVIQR